MTSDYFSLQQEKEFFTREELVQIIRESQVVNFIEKQLTELDTQNE